MKRRTVRSTKTLGTSSLEDCSVEAVDSTYGEGDQAAATQALLVSGIKFSGVTAGSMIKLEVPVLPDRLPFTKRARERVGYTGAITWSGELSF